MATGFVDANGDRLFYEETGSGHPVVFLHTALMDSRQWNPQMQSLSARGYRTIRYDRRGYGGSDLPASSYSHLDDLAHLFDDLDIDRAAFVASSFGGILGIEFAAVHPDRVDALVLAASGCAGFGGWSEKTRATWELMEKAVEAGDLETAQRLELDMWVPQRPDAENNRLIRDIARENLRTYALDEVLELWPERPTEEILQEVGVPTLVIVGDRDLPEMQDIARLLAKGIRGATATSVPGADHLPNLRAPAEFDRVVLEFLEEVLA
jgi:3-oxoadipate enol-lactonase